MIDSKDIQQILQQPDGEELYQVATLVKRALAQQAVAPEVDVEEQWHRFQTKHLQPKRTSHWRAIAASLALAICLLVGAHTRFKGISFRSMSTEPVFTAPVEDVVDAHAMIFHDVPLGEVLNSIASEYGAQVSCNDPQLLQRRLYTKIDKRLTLPEVVSLLDNFDNITIRLSGDSQIIVE